MAGKELSETESGKSLSPLIKKYAVPGKSLPGAAIAISLNDDPFRQ